MSKGFQCAGFGSGFQRECGPVPPPTDEHHGGLYLDPPPGWRAIDPEPHKRRHTEQFYGPIRQPLTPMDDPDELWLLGLTDLETN